MLYSFMMLVIEFIGGEQEVLRKWRHSPIKSIKLVFPLCCWSVQLGKLRASPCVLPFVSPFVFDLEKEEEEREREKRER